MPSCKARTNAVVFTFPLDHAGIRHRATISDATGAKLGESGGVMMTPWLITAATAEKLLREAMNTSAAAK